MKLLRWWRRRRASGRWAQARALILMYHRIAEGEADPWNLCVSPRHFEEQLDVLRRRARIVPLQELAESVASWDVPRGLVAITFDDGYADNLEKGAPRLAQANAPATVFITTGGIGSSREFWWDELDRILLSPGQLPRTLSLTVNGEALAWDLGDTAAYSEAEAASHRSWTANDPPPSLRQSLYLSLWERLCRLSGPEKELVLADLRGQTGVTARGRDARRSLSPDEVVALMKRAPIEIAAHTVTHAPLPLLGAAEQAEELAQARGYLERLTDQKVISFAYPHGAHDAASVARVADAGFKYACTTQAGPVTPSSAPLTLPRVHARDWGGDRFEWQLDHWFTA